MGDRRHFKLTATAGKAKVFVDGRLIDETFDLSLRKELIFFLRSANLPPEEIDRVLIELSTRNSAEFFLG
jgi:hypothetical protein